MNIPERCLCRCELVYKEDKRVGEKKVTLRQAGLLRTIVHSH
ncbi:hypothetical protein LCGC14_1097800 [marine sediment metagenome]|uniref:Uncharacterized protein n=1 Tax=marine sediment metagenome TaxID=412755 RepID=A0A0F9MY93_9ZZZZ